ncbi:hypothetical protein Hhel01_03660 [Haloferula helveola]
MSRSRRNWDTRIAGNWGAARQTAPSPAASVRSYSADTRANSAGFASKAGVTVTVTVWM